MLPEEQAENSRYFYELASARFGWIVGRAEEGAGVPLQARPGRQDRHRRSPARRRRSTGRIAEVRGLPEGTPAVSPPTFPDWHGVDDFRRFADEVRERVGRHPDRRQALGAAHRGRHRRRARDRRRLHHPRRPRRRHRRGAAAVPRQHLGADDPRARPGPPPSRPARSARRHARRHRRPARRAPTSPRRSRSAPTPSRSRTARSRRSAASACARATPTTARSASRRRSRTCGPGCRSTRPSHRLDRFLRGDGRAHAGARPRVRARPPVAVLRSTTSPRSTATWPHSPASTTEASGEPDRRRIRAGAGTRSPSSTTLADGRVKTVTAGPHVARAHARRRRATARSTTTARTRAARSARARSRRAGCAARGTATTTTRSPARRRPASPTRPRASRSRCAPTASTSALPPERRTSAPSPT